MNYYNEIKKEIINNEVYKRVKDYSKNKNELMTYYNIGKLIVEAQGGEKRAKYGNNLIKEYAKRLSIDLDKKYSATNLRYMRQFYLFCKKYHAVHDELTWSHYRELLKIDNLSKINYYINISIKENIGYRKLAKKIKSNEYERLEKSTKLKLLNSEKTGISDYIKNPILIKSNLDYTDVSEKMLKQLILEDMDNFLKELGVGFAYIQNEYKIKLGDRYNYIDILLYNYIYNCFVVVELKATELKKEHIGQIQVYMNYIDEKIKRMDQEKTIGIIVAKKDNEYVIKYCSDSRVYNTTYVLEK